MIKYYNGIGLVLLFIAVISLFITISAGDFSVGTQSATAMVVEEQESVQTIPIHETQEQETCSDGSLCPIENEV